MTIFDLVGKFRIKEKSEKCVCMNRKIQITFSIRETVIGY